MTLEAKHGAAASTKLVHSPKFHMVGRLAQCTHKAKTTVRAFVGCPLACGATVNYNTATH